MIHDKSVNYFASLSGSAWSDQGQCVRAKQMEAPTLEDAQAPREGRGTHLEKAGRLEASALEEQRQSLITIPNRLVETPGKAT